MGRGWGEKCLGARQKRNIQEVKQVVAKWLWVELTQNREKIRLVRQNRPLVIRHAKLAPWGKSRIQTTAILVERTNIKFFNSQLQFEIGMHSQLPESAQLTLLRTVSLHTGYWSGQDMHALGEWTNPIWSVIEIQCFAYVLKRLYFIYIYIFYLIVFAIFFSAN